MRVAGPLPTLQLTAPAGNAWQRALQPGQVLHAVVVSSATAGTALLRVGALELVARTELALARDQSLMLEVVKGGDTPELRLLRPGGEEALIARALRTSLPRQAPLADQLGRLADAGRQLELVADKLTARLGREIGTLLARPLATGTEPRALRQALAQSGLFFEARLAQGSFDAADLKGVLLRLLARLPGQAPAGRGATADAVPGREGGSPPAAPPDHGGALLEATRHLVEDALAGIRWQQISSLPDEGGRGLLWHVGLPLRAPDDTPTTLWLRAERDPAGRESDGQRWTLDLSLSIAPLGPLHAHLSLVDGRVSATIWAEREETASLVDHHLGLLGAGLERAGIAVAHLAARSGRPATGADQPAPPLQCLLDERA